MAIEKERLDRLLARERGVFARPPAGRSEEGALGAHSQHRADEHLDDEREADGLGNRRNENSKKTVLTGTSKRQLSIPRDRAARSIRS